MKYTRHAEIRCKQRGISPEVVDLILAQGKPEKRSGGAWEIRLCGKEKVEWIRQLRRFIQVIDGSKGKGVLVSGDGEVITVYHLTR